MSPRGTMGWSEREEENLLRWLDENRTLPWKPPPDVSARSRKSHDHRKRPGPSRRSVGMKPSQSDAPVKAAAQSNIDLWLQTILTAEPSSSDSSESMLSKHSISDRLTPALTNSFPKKSRPSSWIWEYVHRACATGKLEL
ncbi:hypothetical protein N7451_012169 [Penicillium sp. IBT 35674x]|nr:hypothetical protein N7451_012169 [Penicillium sp. IBT 35674x]